MEQAKTRQQIAYEYGICVRTLNRWFVKAQLAIPNREILPPYLVRKVYERFGCPKLSD